MILIIQGQILAGASLVYPFIYKSLDLEPVFDEKCLEAEEITEDVSGFLSFMAVLGSLPSQTYLEDDAGFLDRE